MGSTHDVMSGGCVASAGYDEMLEELLDCRAILLANYPGLQTVQDEIDTLLSTTIDPMLRLEILTLLMMEKVDVLKGQLEELGHILNLYVP